MDNTISNLVSTTKQMGVREEDLRREMDLLKTELLIEEQNLAILKKECECVGNEVSSNKRALEISSFQVQLLNAFREQFRSSIYTQTILEKFVQGAEPIEEKQQRMLHDLQQNYARMLENYQTIPAYRALIQEDTNEKELNALLVEKRNQLMKLETEKEY